jgi:predicted aspartyl protease
MPLVDGFPVVMVMVNGQGPYPFIVDTGTTNVVISPRLADDLRLPRKGTDARLRASNGRVLHAPRTRLDSLSLGGATFDDVPAVISPTLQRDVRGLLGMRLFRTGVLTLAFPSHRLLLRPGHLDPSDPDTLGVPFDQDVPSLPVTPPTTGRRRTVYIDLDSGMNGGVILPADMGDRLSLDPAYRSRVRTETAGGAETLQMVHLMGPLRLATHTLESPYVLLAPDRCRVGTLSLRRYDVGIDRAAGRVRLSPAAPPANSP